MSTDWGKILDMKFSKIVLGIIVLIILAIVSVGLFSNKPIKIWFIEFNIKEEAKRDTVYIEENKKATPITNTNQPPAIIIKPNPKKDSILGEARVSKKQTIKENSSGIQNNAPNYGVQAGRDINNNYGIIPREVTQELLNTIYKEAPDKNTEIYVARMSDESESYEYSTKIISALKKNGYNRVFLDGLMNTNLIGASDEEIYEYKHTFKFRKQDGYLSIIVPLNKK